MDWAARVGGAWVQNLRTPKVDDTLRRLEEADTSLTEVAVAGAVTNAQMRGLCKALPNAPWVRAVKFMKAPLTDSTVGRVLEVVRGLPAVAALTLDGVGLQNTTLAGTVADLAAMPALKKLSLCGNALTDAAPLRGLLTAPGCKLETLALDGNKIGIHGADASELARALAQNASLRTLSLADNRLDASFTDALMEVLFESNFTICSVVLKGNPGVPRDAMEAVSLHLDKNRVERPKDPAAADGGSTTDNSPRSVGDSVAAGVEGIARLIRRASQTSEPKAPSEHHEATSGCFPLVGRAASDLQSEASGAAAPRAGAPAPGVERLQAEANELRLLLAEETKLNRQQEVDFEHSVQLLKAQLADAAARHENQLNVLRNEVHELRTRPVTRALADEHSRLETLDDAAAPDGGDDGGGDDSTVTATKVLGAGRGKGRGGRKQRQKSARQVSVEPASPDEAAAEAARAAALEARVAELEERAGRAEVLESRVKELEGELLAAASSLAAAGGGEDEGAGDAAPVLARLRSDLSAKGDQLDDLKREATRAAEAFGNVHAQLESEVDRLNAAHAEQAAKQREAHEEEKAALNAALASLERQLADARGQPAAASAGGGEEAEAEIARLREVVRGLEAELEARAEATVAAAAAEDTQTKLADLEATVAGLREADAAACAEAAALREAVAVHEGEAGAAKVAAAELERQLAAAAAARAAQDAAASEMKQTIAVLQEAVEEKTASVDEAAAGANEALAAKAAELEAACVRLTEVDGELAAAREAHGAKVEDLEAQVIDLQSRNETLTLDVETLTEAAEAAQGTVEKELGEAKEQLQQVEKAKAAVDVEHRKLQKEGRAKVDKLEKQVRDKDAALAVANAKLREAEEQYEQLEAQQKRGRLQEEQYLNEIQGMRAARKEMDRDVLRLQQKLLAQQEEFNAQNEARDKEADELREKVAAMEAEAEAEAAACQAQSGGEGDLSGDDASLSGSASGGKLSKKDWVASKGVKACQHCDQKFTLRNRKHHCRWCGKVFCGQCCAASQLTGGDRVCVECNKAKS
eukprot:TRINITY_DN859_c0_g1_i1.p1 TRINITY_DN859_c0_g1~~TRINITY_DN859_c0_g1_i1.p1  ORF type:complete len:1045 (+),score=484.81 TRINITY_DN859_c0_g1_i1:98-3232(+)